MGYDQVVQRAADRRQVDGARRTTRRATCSTIITPSPKYYTLTQHLIVPEILVFSRKAWDTLSKNRQALVKGKIRGREAQAEGSSDPVEQMRKGRQALPTGPKPKAAGNEMSDVADKKPFRNAVQAGGGG